MSKKETSANTAPNGWNTVTGVILQADSFHATRSGPSGWVVRYAYDVDGQRYEKNIRDYANKQPRDYKVRGKVEIEYRPDTPAKSRVVVAQSYFRWVWPKYLVGVIAILIIVVMNHHIHRHPSLAVQPMPASVPH